MASRAVSRSLARSFSVIGASDVAVSTKAAFGSATISIA